MATNPYIMISTFKVGDIVLFQNSDLEMTVESINEEKNMITCIWQDGKDFKSRDFKAELLRQKRKPANIPGISF